MHAQTDKQAGFTLTEMVISTAILVVAISLGMTGYLYIWSESSRSGIQDALDIAVQASIEKIKRDLRLTALEKIFYFPSGAGPYTALSMPRARDDDGDGAVDIDSSGKIIWDQTVIYHVWSGNPSQLRKTTIDPRDSSLTVTQTQAQLNSVAIVGNASATYGSTNATTEVIFENLFSWNVKPQSSTFDGYAPVTERSLGDVLGTAVLSNGNHTLQFRIVGKNPSSSSYKMGVDTLFMSPSASIREAEAQLPATAVSGATIPTNVYMSAGSWSGNYHLSFPSTAINRSFTLTMASDRWEETNFRATGETHEDTTVLFDTSLTPSDFVLQLDGNITNWSATAQTADPSGSQDDFDNLKGSAVRVLLRGKDIDESGFILSNGGRCRVLFCAGTNGNLRIDGAFIAVADATNTMDAVPGTMTRLWFGGANGVSINRGETAWSDLVAFDISKSQMYLDTYIVNN
ncbi:MAG: prepilin-type N-terminal cleavage/methylation domain-containing protein, partial [Verrucomicrobia bacterium]|nr:prepilin-type N-terminal cleavage/methylation domain-containing protein [Verrucomicrobiota bacterium]